MKKVNIKFTDGQTEEVYVDRASWGPSNALTLATGKAMTVDGMGTYPFSRVIPFTQIAVFTVKELTK